MVVWEGGGQKLGFENVEDKDDKWDMILPQVIAMDTISRCAIEKTWLTASNAKKNRVGSELKPWSVHRPATRSSVPMWTADLPGDAQFGMHGATALGWMTIEGTKSAPGTDFNSKTEKILGLPRPS